MAKLLNNVKIPLNSKTEPRSCRAAQSNTARLASYFVLSLETNKSWAVHQICMIYLQPFFWQLSSSFNTMISMCFLFLKTHGRKCTEVQIKKYISSLFTRAHAAQPVGSYLFLWKTKREILIQFTHLFLIKQSLSSPKKKKNHKRSKMKAP